MQRTVSLFRVIDSVWFHETWLISSRLAYLSQHLCAPSVTLSPSHKIAYSLQEHETPLPFSPTNVHFLNNHSFYFPCPVVFSTFNILLPSQTRRAPQKGLAPYERVPICVVMPCPKSPRPLFRAPDNVTHLLLPIARKKRANENKISQLHNRAGGFLAPVSPCMTYTVQLRVVF